MLCCGWRYFNTLHSGHIRDGNRTRLCLSRKKAAIQWAKRRPHEAVIASQSPFAANPGPSVEWWQDRAPRCPRSADGGHQARSWRVAVQEA